MHENFYLNFFLKKKVILDVTFKVTPGRYDGLKKNFQLYYSDIF
jgi:hypothetical protein